jgi:hypothetical protein
MVVAVVAGITWIPRSVTAQVTRADSANVLMAIARDLIAEGREDRALALLALVVERYGDTAPARDAVTQLAELRATARESGGERELVAWSTVYGAAVGLLIPAALGAEEGAPYGAGLLLGTPLGFFASRSYANAHQMTPGHARAITFGTWWGAWQGVGWQEVFDIGDGEDVVCPTPDECFVIETDSERAPFTAALIGSLTGMGMGALLGQTRPISASTALITNFAALWGSWYGLAGGVIAGAEEDGLLTSTLIGGNLGLFVGALGGPHMQMTTGRAWLVHLSGIAGLAVGGGIDLLAEPDDVELGVLIPALTSGIGLAIGFATTTPETGGVDLGASGSLASYAGGRWSLGIPLPVPAVQHAVPGRATLGLRFDLVRATW